MPAFKRKAPTYPWQYFDWCGPYISDGKFQSSTAGFTTARSVQEQACKEHDIAYTKCKSRKCFEEADRKFHDDSWALGAFGKLAGTAVYYGGSLFHGSYEEDGEEKTSENRKRAAEDTPQESQKRLRGNPNLSGQKRPAKSSSSSQRNSRRRLHFDPNNQSPPENPFLRMSGSGTTTNGTQGEVGLMPFGKPAQYAPQYFTTKLKWCSRETFKVNNGTLLKREYRINSPLDPNYLATDHTDTLSNATVNGWSEYATRYKYYRLVNTKCKVEFLFPDDSYHSTTALTQDQLHYQNSWPKICGVALNPGRMFPYSNAGMNNLNQFVNGKYVDYRTMVGTNNKQVFTIDYDPYAWQTPVMEQQREQFWTDVKKNPPLQDHFHLFAQTFQRGPANLTVDANLTCVVFITMEFTVQFREWADSVIANSLGADIRNLDDVGVTSQANAPNTADQVMVDNS